MRHGRSAHEIDLGWSELGHHCASKPRKPPSPAGWAYEVRIPPEGNIGRNDGKSNTGRSCKYRTAVQRFLRIPCQFHMAFVKIRFVRRPERVTGLRRRMARPTKLLSCVRGTQRSFPLTIRARPYRHDRHLSPPTAVYGALRTKCSRASHSTHVALRPTPLIRPRFARPPSPTRGEGGVSRRCLCKSPMLAIGRSGNARLRPSPLVGEGGLAKRGRMRGVGRSTTCPADHRQQKAGI
jgi:hypothetical protein